MPNCPDCHEILTFIEAGSQCDLCGRYFTAEQTGNLPGFDIDAAILSHEILRAIKDLDFPPDTTFRVYSYPGGYQIEPVLPAVRQVFSAN